MLLYAETFRVDLRADSKINGLIAFFDFVSQRALAPSGRRWEALPLEPASPGNPQSSVNNPG
jgi:hypothetical protein